MLCTRYKNASEMRESAEIYYQKFKAGLSHENIAKWTQEIENAESQRLKDITVMDIMQTRPVDNSSDGMGSEEPISLLSPSLDEEWVQMGIDLEEQQ